VTGQARAQSPQQQAPAASAAGGAEVWHALRVSVEPSVRDPSLYIVRRLEADKPVPHGTREAFLVVVESSADLLALSRGGQGSTARH
jgi:hypothetical protein